MEEKHSNITIDEYLQLLKTGSNPILCREIGDFLSSKITGVSGGFDLHLFQLQKDLLLFQCKLLIAVFEFDEDRQIMYSNRIDDLKSQIKKKTENKKSEENNPYKSFLEWLFALKKYYGSEIDRDQTLIELIVATDQMMKFYSSQNEQIKNQKAK